ncbi:MAG TPA: hypothetical protein VHF06_21375 [Pseudonocardiaceae bacterium]|nr:hypothetical protein [Pseudonocardiaceae bacterium]
MSSPSLAVPVALDALVVNNSVLARDTFRWWQYNYTSLNYFRSPEPLALDRSVGGQQAGVYLQWTLPDALRHAEPDPVTGKSAYPLVPNRWLVVRVNGTTTRQATAWVVESDCPFTSRVTTTSSALTSQYLADPTLVQQWRGSSDPIRAAVDPAGQTAAGLVARIGVAFPLGQWTERAEDPMFLTAVAPSNPLFNSYVAHNIGVFSFYDDLHGIDSGTLSYFVAGWYSDPDGDVLASWPTDTASTTPYADLLAQLRWNVIDTTDPASRVTSVYHGAALSIAWSRGGPAPADDPLQAIRDSGELNVGVGNTTVDAFTALIGGQLGDPTKTALLRAFQYGFLDQLNQLNGAALLDEKIREAGFDTTPGGYSWTVVAQESDGTTTVTLTDDEQQWLSALNQAQADLDAAVTRLHSLQWQLYGLWLKNGYLSNSANTFPVPPAGIPAGGLATFRASLAAQLDPAHAGSVAAQLVAQIATVQNLATAVPTPTSAADPQTALQEGIQQFAQAKGLDPDKVLKVKAAPRYWRANNPVVVVSGVDPSPTAVTGAVLDVRDVENVVSGFHVSGGLVDAGAVATLLATLPSLAALPASVPPLLREFLLLDPANATAIAQATGRDVAAVTAAMTAHDPAAYQGSLPDLDLAPWQQPWNPMFLEWSTTYSPVPLGTATASGWTFDGTDYRCTADPGSERRTLSGISLLSPHTATVFGSRLDSFVQQFGDTTELAQIDAWVQQVYGWRLLAQELTGFNELLSLRDVRAARRPGPTDLAGTLPIGALTGDQDVDPPPATALPSGAQPLHATVPFLPNGPAIPFHGSRQGQLYFTDLYLYDKFGRALFVLESTGSSGLFDYRNFPVLLDDALRPDIPSKSGVQSVAQLRPRLLQHARLDFRLVDAVDDTKVLDVAPGVTPVAGWVLPNHLDRSLLLYAPDGRALGEYRLVAQADGTRVGEWQAPPHTTMTLDDVGTAAPHVHSMITAAGLRDEAGFEAFLASIDETLWTTDPLGNRVDQNLSVLVGRPLALLRARLRFELDGDPIGDTGWAATFQQPAPDFIGFPFRIRLGDQLTRQDGLIGYFAGTDYDVFNSVAAPDATQGYVRPIGPVGDPEGDNYLSLTFGAGDSVYVTALADPRAAVHAVTGILPVKQLDIPQGFVDAALAALEISFRTGPVLTTVAPTPDEGDAPPPFPQSVAHPLPVEQNGQWSWWEPDAAGGPWTGYGLTRVTPDALPGAGPASLRDGWLQFITDLTR